MTPTIRFLRRHPDLHEEIRPGQPGRPMWEAQGGRFPMRCLPMPMANRHGWELVCQSDFRARWTGGPAPQHVEVMCREPWCGPAGHFGSGYLTVQMAGFFRFPEGTNAWLTGPPNYCKAGAYPMTGLVEWDQLPYIATMNYQLTDPGRWVQWQKGEPYAFIMPMPRGYVESFDAKVALLDEHPDIKRQHDAWAADRQGRGHSQGYLYTQGEYPDGSKFPHGHQTKLKVCPFA